MKTSTIALIFVIFLILLIFLVGVICSAFKITNINSTNITITNMILGSGATIEGETYGYSYGIFGYNIPETYTFTVNSVSQNPYIIYVTANESYVFMNNAILSGSDCQIISSTNSNIYVYA